MTRRLLRCAGWAALASVAVSALAFGVLTWKAGFREAAGTAREMAMLWGGEVYDRVAAWRRGPDELRPQAWTRAHRPHDDDPVFAAMLGELGRSQEKLRLPDLEEPDWIAYTVRESRRWEGKASFGALQRRRAERSRVARVEVRVGDRKLDNSRFVKSSDWEYAPTTQDLPLEDGMDALRTALWRATDAAYKDALEKLAKKRAVVDKDTRLPDLIRGDPGNRFDTGPPPDTPAPQGLDVEALAKKLSWVFRGRRRVRAADATVVFNRVRWRRLDTDYNASRRDEAFLGVSLWLQFKTRDGRELSHEAKLLYPALERLPSEEALVAEARALAEEFERQAAGRGPEDYVGPVLFLGQAAAEFFNQALADPLSFPRPWDSDDEDLAAKFRTGGLAGRLGMQVAPAFLEAYLDPTVSEEDGLPLAGHYWVDDEGVRARRVPVLEKGRLKGLAMSQAPVKGLRESNGHGRSPLGGWPQGRVSNLFVRGSEPMERDALKARLKALAKEQGLERALVVTRMAGGEERKEGAFFSAPVSAWLVDVEGQRVEPANGLEFAEAGLGVLREVAAVSKARTIYNLEQTGPPRHEKPSAVQASIIAPDVLVREMALRRPAEEPKDEDILESPLASQPAEPEPAAVTAPGDPL